ncbi:MAG: bifunctional precorrin-2 dehydrogenase/sirohydrochlorin ferrochelatase [Lachnospiraceae bacterium]|nr:bifunctional precorrin-2 dehydrogenase/sirohydrochlorin ferrochelatase [Lachnospiraceae bacterium]
MNYFPFFVDVTEQPGLIVGGGRIALHKVQKLAPFHAKLTIVAEEFLPAFAEYEQAGVISCIKKKFEDTDVESQLFVIAATDDENLNGRISELCKEKRILVNVVDDQEKCGFLFPSLVKAGDFVAGISTGGASPQIAVTARKRIEEELPSSMEEILEVLAAVRPEAKRRIGASGQRAAFFKEAASLSLEEDRALSAEELEALLRKYE